MRLAKRIRESVRCSALGTGWMSRAETVEEAPLAHTRDRAGGLRSGHCFGMREIEGRERRLRIPAPTRSWNTPCSARAYPVLEAQPSRTWESQSLGSHVGVGGRRVSEVFSPAQG